MKGRKRKSRGKEDERGYVFKRRGRKRGERVIEGNERKGK
jgi:hypothetical protein